MQTFGSLVTVVNAGNDIAGDQNCDGPYSLSWHASTSFNRGVTWFYQGVLVDVDYYNPAPLPPPNTIGQLTCLPDAQTGVLQTGIRNFAFTIDRVGAMWVATPVDGNAGGFHVFRSTNLGSSFELFQDVGAGSAFTLHPALATDDAGRVALSFQVIGTTRTGGFGITTWLAAIPSLASGFVGPTPISGGYVADNPPPTGTCAHPLCTTGVGLPSGCDDASNGGADCVSVIDTAYPSCASSWDRACVYHVGNVTGCKGYYSCGGRTLGDYDAMAFIPLGDIPGVTATFMPAWSEGTAPPISAHEASALVTVSP